LRDDRRPSRFCRRLSEHRQTELSARFSLLIRGIVGPAIEQRGNDAVTIDGQPGASGYVVSASKDPALLVENERR
jgi:hypothetical protein